MPLTASPHESPIDGQRNTDQRHDQQQPAKSELRGAGHGGLWGCGVCGVCGVLSVGSDSRYRSSVIGRAATTDHRPRTQLRQHLYALKNFLVRKLAFRRYDHVAGRLAAAIQNELDVIGRFKSFAARIVAVDEDSCLG